MLALNKRAVRRSIEAMGIRTALSTTTKLQALARFQPASIEHRNALKQDVTTALSARDKGFADYREATD